jgi:hypothetical protein
MPVFYNEKGDDDIKRPVLREYLWQDGGDIFYVFV